MQHMSQPKPAATVRAQAQLQGLVCQLVDAFREQRPELTGEAAFELLTAAAWGYARQESTNEEIINRMRAAAMACELARQHAVNVLERNGAQKAGQS